MNNRTIIMAAMVVAVVMMMGTASAAVTVTAATGGDAISADDVGVGWTDLGPIVITEGATTDFAVGAGATIILTAPTGFEFNTAQSTDAAISATADISAITTPVAITASTITVTYTIGGTTTSDSITIGGVTPIQVQPTDGTPLATGDLLRTAASPGTAIVAGITNDATNFGTLQEVAGAATQLVFTVQPAGSVSGVALTTQPVVQVQDAHGNLDTTCTADVVAATDDAGTLAGTTSIAAVAGVATFTDLVYTATADPETFQIDVASTGLTGATSNDVVSDVVATKFVILNPTDGTVDAAITVTVQAQDAGGNVDTSCSDDVTLVAGGSATGAGLVDLVNGVGTLDISDTVEETVALSLTNSEGTGLDVGSMQDVIFGPGTVPTVAGALDTLYVDVDGQDCEAVTALTIKSTAAGDIKGGSSINITLSDANVTFDLSQEPDVTNAGEDGITAVSVTKFTATEIGIEVTGDSIAGEGDMITLGGATALRINLSAGTPSTTVVDFTVKTTPAVGTLKSQDYDALNIVREVPDDVTITHNGVDNSVTAGTNVVLTAHAASGNIAHYGGWQVNFNITDAPSPLTWTANGLNSSFDNTSLDQYEEVTTGSDGDATLNLKLSTRSSEEDVGTKTDVKAHLNGTAVAAVKLSDGGNVITTVDDYETHVNVTSDYESAVADGAELIKFTAQLRDQYDNFVETGGNASSGIGVGLSGDALPDADLPSAFVAGAVTFEVQDATQESVTATVDSVVVGIATGSKTVNYVSDAYGIALTTNRTSCQADESSVIRVYAQLLDASGNPLALHKDTWEGVAGPTSWTYSQSNIIFEQDVEFTEVNASGANCVDLVAGAYSGVTDVTVYYNTNSGSTVSSKITLTATQSVNAANTGVSTTSLSIKADETATFTVMVKDNNNQPLENGVVTFKIEGGNGTLTNADNSLESATGLNQTLTVLSDSTGGVAVEFFNRDVTETDVVNITVVDGGVTTKVGSAPYAVAVAHANASTIVLTPVSQGIKNVNGTTATINVTLTDAYGNPVDDNLVLNVTNGNPALGDLDAGVVDGQITLVGGTKEVVFTIDSEPLVASATILFEAFNTYNSACLTANLTGFTATVTTSGPSDVIVSFNKTAPVVDEIVAVCAQLTDPDGNALGIADKDMTFTVVKSGETVPIAVGVETTNATGMAVYNMTVSALGTYTVTASNSTLGLGNESSITFAGSMVSIVATANGTTDTHSTPVNKVVIVNATAMDSAGNVATGASGTVRFLVDSTDIGSAAFVNGVASITYTNAVVETCTVMAWHNATVSDTVDVTFTEDMTPRLTVTAAPATVTANTLTDVVFTVTSDGAAVSGTAVDGALVTLSGAGVSESGTTVADGTVTIAVTATSEGTITVTAAKTGYVDGTTTVTARSTSVIDQYDADNDGVISKDEAVAAITDYFALKITKDEAIEVITAYFG
ncbi:MAG: hypothetical protein KAR25_00015 [Methanosarcinales archaeon]|nr:hypothetical protein [Methanosarcinales archaeon]